MLFRIQLLTSTETRKICTLRTQYTHENGPRNQGGYIDRLQFWFLALMWLRLTLGDSGWLWMTPTPDSSGRFQKLRLRHQPTPNEFDSGRLRTIPTPDDSGRLRTTLDDSERLRLWTPPDDSRRLRTTPHDSPRLWLRATLDDSGRLWLTLDHSGWLQAILDGSRRFQTAPHKRTYLLESVLDICPTLPFTMMNISFKVKHNLHLPVCSSSNYS